jgi:hypothetical protein
MTRSQARLLILLNATAAASSFVGSLLLADRLTHVPFLGIVLGLIGCGYFTNRAERIRRSMRRPDSADD